jgi:hypothetical protein
MPKIAVETGVTRILFHVRFPEPKTDEQGDEFDGIMSALEDMKDVTEVDYDEDFNIVVEAENPDGKYIALKRQEIKDTIEANLY